MADAKITALNELAATPDGGDLLAIVDGGTETKKITVTNLTAGVGGGTPQLTISTVFESTARFTTTFIGGGIATVNATEMQVGTSATITSSSKVLLFVVAGGNYDSPFASNSQFSTLGNYIRIEGTDYHMYFGVGALTVEGTGSGITYTGSQYGFKRTRASSGAAETSATNADGATETATVFTLVNQRSLHAKKTGTTNIKFYNDRTLEATHTTNLPSAALGTVMQIAVSNLGVASNTNIGMGFYNYSQDAE
ncbi:hypothetical protein LCGC14_0540580 [marine sediment metagenome]|uniref:Uncharacterized protein n=1 Tax=marine sediment metagenome TaxID=412755 RepID=A0A0F9RT15_9ZZZZ